ncbi:hypothetical protein CWATWH0401_2856 [Crocosphaera watsonii WH 0401]|uniref:Uncharacterized protein n=1 Tax=Crocosphaera watsonii WH 0401 TaxID=555881 RepID=T2JF90_CROWT|nr:hypothetical protein CWATWH0401_2856 [Crocosphaera watsonii WH 0401]
MTVTFQSILIIESVLTVMVSSGLRVTNKAAKAGRQRTLNSTG